MTEITYDNGVVTTNTYQDSRGWLMEVETVLSSTTLQSVVYTRDDAGRIETMDVGPASEAWTYTYDDIDRLLSAANASDTNTSRNYTYDDAGNLAWKSDVGSYSYPTQGPSAARPHAVTAAGSDSYTYDDNGNMLSGAGRTLTFDGDNRLIEVETATATTDYAYGPDGARVKTTTTPVSGPAEVSFILGTTEIDDAGTYTKVPHPDVRIVGSDVCFVHRDHLATVRLETDRQRCGRPPPALPVGSLPTARPASRCRMASDTCTVGVARAGVFRLDWVPMRPKLTALSIFLAVAAAAPAARAEDTPVDLELVLAIDTSQSVDIGEGILQRNGYIRALKDPQVIQAITSAPYGRIAVTYIEWGGAFQQRTVVDWTIIDSAESAAVFADRLANTPVGHGQGTSISGMLQSAMGMFDGNGATAERRVIDISGDGPNSSGGNVAEARDAAVAAGFVINGVAINNDDGSAFTLPDLDVYYRECVIGGLASFVIAADGFASFAEAIRRKLILEVAGRSLPVTPVQARVGQKYAPACDIGERMRMGDNPFLR